MKKLKTADGRDLSRVTQLVNERAMTQILSLTDVLFIPHRESSILEI